MRLETVGVVSYNLWRGNKAEYIVEDVTYLMGRREVDVIVLQEGANWYGLLDRLIQQTRGTWEMSQTANGTRGSKQNIVLWRTKQFTLKSCRLVDLPEGKRGLTDRSVTRVRLRFNGSKRQLVILASHMHSHVQNPTWWRLPRQGDYRSHIGLIRSMVPQVRKNRAVLAVADWNVDLRNSLVARAPFFPPKQLAKVKMRSNWASLGFEGLSGTHGRRFIDAIFLRHTPWIRFKDQQVIRLTSDHRALLVRFTITLATPIDHRS